MAARSRPLSLPHEHGAWVMLVGGTAAAALVATRPLAALGVGLALLGGFVAREPLVKRARWDGALLAAAALVTAGGVALAWGWAGWAALGAAALEVVGFLIARRAKQHRAPLFELLGMGALGAGAGLAALAGGAPLRSAALLGGVLAVYGVVTVPVVRTQIRPRERAGAHRAELAALAALAVAAGALAAAGAPWCAAAFAPRALHLVGRAVRGVRPLRPSLVGMRETFMLAATLGIAVTALLGG
jgi:hypothetical protein